MNASPHVEQATVRLNKHLRKEVGFTSFGQKRAQTVVVLGKEQ